MLPVNQIIQGNALDVLKTFPAESVDCVTTSPPYWGLRNYGTGKWEGGNVDCDHKFTKEKSYLDFSLANSSIQDSNRTGTDAPRWKDICPSCGAKRIDEQIGLEKTPEEYVAKIVEIFQEIKRILKEKGTVWLNLGDTYFVGGGGNQYSPENQGFTSKAFKANPEYEKSAGFSYGYRRQKRDDLKPKDLCGIPWMVAFALRTDGWYLRQDIIWHKPNPMPESVTDRCTRSHEYVFLLAKSHKYYFDSDAIKEKATGYDGRKDTIMKGSKKYRDGSYLAGGNANSLSAKGRERWRYKNLQEDGQQPNTFHLKRLKGEEYLSPIRNKRSVWTITTKSFKEAHFAVFPEELIKPMIKAGCPRFVCKECGKPKERTFESSPIPEECKTYLTEDEMKGKRSGSLIGCPTNEKYEEWRRNNPPKEKWIECSCNAGFESGIVLDPFIGSGTTALVALKNNRRFVGIELNKNYIDIAYKRIKPYLLQAKLVA